MISEKIKKPQFYNIVQSKEMMPGVCNYVNYQKRYILSLDLPGRDFRKDPLAQKIVKLMEKDIIEDQNE